jgi:hypothetical protein
MTGGIISSIFAESPLELTHTFPSVIFPKKPIGYRVPFRSSSKPMLPRPLPSIQREEKLFRHSILEYERLSPRTDPVDWRAAQACQTKGFRKPPRRLCLGTWEHAPSWACRGWPRTLQMRYAGVSLGLLCMRSYRQTFMKRFVGWALVNMGLRDLDIWR